MSRPGRDLVLYVVVLLLACACVAGGVFVKREHDDRQALHDRARLYGEVIAAAETTATAMINIDGTADPQADFDEVAASATGTFLEQWQAGQESLVKEAADAGAVSEGQVVSAAVSSLDSDSATVLVATSGTVRNEQADEALRQYRYLMRMTRVDGRWLTSDLEFVCLQDLSDPGSC